MKKVLLGAITVFSLVVFGACTSNEKKESAESTISSLRAENEKLKAELNGDSSYDDSSSDSSKDSSSENIEDTEYTGLNEDVHLSNGSKETAIIKVTQATTNQSAFPEHMISLDNYDTTKMVAVTIDYTNVAMSSPFLPNASYFQAFTKDGKALVQVNQQNGQDAVGTGRTGTTQIFFELPVPGDQFDQMEMDFVVQSKIATFDLPISH